jgi:hypothetical protein
MEPVKNVHEETAAELCERADAEQDFDKLLELASKLQRLIEARRAKDAKE